MTRKPISRTALAVLVATIAAGGVRAQVTSGSIGAAPGAPGGPMGVVGAGIPGAGGTGPNVDLTRVSLDGSAASAQERAPLPALVKAVALALPGISPLHQDMARAMVEVGPFERPESAAVRRTFWAPFEEHLSRVNGNVQDAMSRTALSVSVRAEVLAGAREAQSDISRKDAEDADVIVRHVPTGMLPEGFERAFPIADLDRLGRTRPGLARAIHDVLSEFRPAEADGDAPEFGDAADAMGDVAERLQVNHYNYETPRNELQAMWLAGNHWIRLRAPNVVDAEWLEPLGRLPEPTAELRELRGKERAAVAAGFREASWAGLVDLFMSFPMKDLLGGLRRVGAAGYPRAIAWADALEFDRWGLHRDRAGGLFARDEQLDAFYPRRAAQVVTILDGIMPELKEMVLDRIFLLQFRERAIRLALDVEHSRDLAAELASRGR